MTLIELWVGGGGVGEVGGGPLTKGATLVLSSQVTVIPLLVVASVYVNDNVVMLMIFSVNLAVRP